MRKIIILLLLILITGCSQKMAKEKTQDFNFSCPDSPNCVSSLAEDEQHLIAPLSFTGEAKTAMTKIEEIIKGMKRTEILTATDTKLHAVFTSKLFRFKDDIYFEVNEEEKTINVKSASRVGYSDLGVNKKRVEAIRSLFNN